MVHISCGGDLTAVLLPCAGQSKGFCYVNYSSREAAALALDTLNGVEWPPASGARLKVRPVHVSHITTCFCTCQQSSQTACMPCWLTQCK